MKEKPQVLSAQSREMLKHGLDGRRGLAPEPSSPSRMTIPEAAAP